MANPDEKTHPPDRVSAAMAPELSPECRTALHKIEHYANDQDVTWSFGVRHMGGGGGAHWVTISAMRWRRASRDLTSGKLVAMSDDALRQTAIGLIDRLDREDRHVLGKLIGEAGLVENADEIERICIEAYPEMPLLQAMGRWLVDRVRDLAGGDARLRDQVSRKFSDAVERGQAVVWVEYEEDPGVWHAVRGHRLLCSRTLTGGIGGPVPQPPVPGLRCGECVTARRMGGGM